MDSNNFIKMKKREKEGKKESRIEREKRQKEIKNETKRKKERNLEVQVQ